MKKIWFLESTLFVLIELIKANPDLNQENFLNKTFKLSWRGKFLTKISNLDNKYLQKLGTRDIPDP